MTLLIVLAGVCVFAGSFAVWLDRELLDTGNWVSTSSRILANRTVQDALGVYIVHQLLSSPRVARSLGSGLPIQQALGPLGAELQQPAGEAVAGLAAEPPVQAAWRDANRMAQRQLLDVLDGRTQPAAAGGGEVVLDLHPLVRDLARRLALGPTAAGADQGLLGALAGPATQAIGRQLLHERIPAGRGRIVILRSSQLQTAQNLLEAIRALAVALPAAALACLALAMLLARGWRGIALRRIGWCLGAAGIAIVIARRVLEGRVVDALLASPSYRPGAEAAWSIATRPLLAAGVSLIVLGGLIAAASVSGARFTARRRLLAA